MDYTTNYQLPVWAETDRILMDDFNDSYEKIDAALKTNADAAAASAASASAAATAVNAKGNCQTFLTAYVGTGNVQGGRQLVFPNKPFLAFLLDVYTGQCYPLPYGATQTQGSLGTPMYGISWSGNVLTLPTSVQQTAANEAGRSYHLFVLLERQ